MAAVEALQECVDTCRKPFTDVANALFDMDTKLRACQSSHVLPSLACVGGFAGVPCFRIFRDRRGDKFLRKYSRWAPITFDTLCVNTTPKPRTRRTPAHVIFSRVAQDLSHRVRNRCVSQNSHSSRPAQHVAHALVVVSFTIEHYFTSHMHANPTFYPTIYQTFISVY